jgi:CRP/FNR family transcriptional regulator, cyclic AMP receptor protein
MTSGENHAQGDFAGGLPSHVQRALESIGQPVTFAAGEILMREGHEPDRVYVIASGVVKVTWVTSAGAEIVLGFRRAGELLGELSALDLEPSSATATAVNDVRAHVLSTVAFARYMKSDAAGTFEMLRFLSRRFRDADRKLIEFGSSDALGRVASRLLELAGDYGQSAEHGMTIALPLSQDELAAWAGCSRKAAVNALRTLRETRTIETKRKEITILDLEALRRLTAL